LLTRSRKLDIVVAFIFGLIISIPLSLQLVYSWTGNTNTFSPGFAEINQINATQYFFRSNNRSQVLQGNFTGIGVVTDNLDSSGYINGSEFYQNSANRTDSLQFPEYPVSYVIFTDGTNYYSKNCTTGQIDFWGTNISSITQSTINALSSNGGKILYREATYTFPTYVTWPTDAAEYTNPIIIEGEGWNTVLTRSANFPIFRIDGGASRCRNVFLRDLQFKSGAFLGELLRFVHADKIRLEDVLFYAHTLSSYGIYAEDSWDAVVYGCFFHGGGNTSQAIVYLYNGGVGDNCNNWRFVESRFERGLTFNSLAIHSDGTGLGSDNHNIHILACKFHGAVNVGFTNGAILFNSTVRSSIKDNYIAHHLGNVVEVDQNCNLIEVKDNHFLTYIAQGNPNSFVRIGSDNSEVGGVLSEGSPTQIVLVDATSSNSTVRDVSSQTSGIMFVTDNGVATINVVERIGGNYSSTGLITPWLDLGGVNRTIWPTTGALNFSRLPMDYIVYYNSTDNTYKGVNGSTGIIDYSNANPTTTIENVWSHLGGLGGGSFKTVGPGETWTITARIDSQGAYVEWFGDWGLTLTVTNALNDAMVRITHDFCKVDGVHLDGNWLNQGAPGVGISGCGIVVYCARDCKVVNCLIEEVRKFGVWFYGTNGDRVLFGEISENRLNATQWNGIQIGTYAYYVSCEENLIDGFGDVGITVTGWYNTIHGNIVCRGYLVNSSANTGWAYSAESFGINGSYNVFDGNQAWDCKSGFVATTNASRNVFSDGMIVNENLQVGAWGYMAWLQGPRNKIVTTQFVDNSGEAQDYGVECRVGNESIVDDCLFVNINRAIRVAQNADRCRINRNDFDNCGEGLRIEAGCNSTWADDNYFDYCIDAVNDLSGDTNWGDNVDENGNWDQGVEP